MFAKFIGGVLGLKWVAFTTTETDEPELGISVCGVIFGLYKGNVYIPTDIASVRPPGKREFGESLRPQEKES